MNPSVVGNFGYCKLGFLNDNSFDTIAYEGLSISKHAYPELKRLLRPSGKVVYIHQPFQEIKEIQEQVVLTYDDL